MGLSQRHCLYIGKLEQKGIRVERVKERRRVEKWKEERKRRWKEERGREEGKEGGKERGREKGRKVVGMEQAAKASD